MRRESLRKNVVNSLLIKWFYYYTIVTILLNIKAIITDKVGVTMVKYSR